MALLASFCVGWWVTNAFVTDAITDLTRSSDSTCPIYDYVRPETVHSTILDKIMRSLVFREQSAAKLSGAIQFETTTFDTSPSVEDNPKYWAEKFQPFHDYLENTFPLVYAHLKVEKVHSWGLVYTWQGTSDKKPLLLMAHQDVVPIQEATLKDWTHPPFDGVYDGEFLWGRGSADCKNLLLGILESIEELIKIDFTPQRSIVLGFGFDEEVGGRRGASSIADLLTERYGPDSFYAIIDEGGISLIEQEGLTLALPGTSEKGSVNINIDLTTPGGHSSVPPDHTSIGIMSELVYELESKKFESFFTPKNPIYWGFQCIATHSKGINPRLKRDILNAGTDRRANRRVREHLSQDKLTRYLIQTSQAIDIIEGGAKSNALPEHVSLVVNHRVAIESTVDETVSKDLTQLLAVAAKFDLGVYDITQARQLRNDTASGRFEILYDDPLEVAPVTPINDEHWLNLAGVIRHVYEEVAYPEKYGAENPIVVAPGISTGNTDTRWYWALTEHVYRYRPGIAHTLQTKAHSVDEHIPFESHLQIIAFYFEYLQVVDALA
ncbi:hypothetical protein BABINDRAFT_34730 [Babjeviella inositovora NRRL Y-12698]|uniref:Peptidase M20 dimerisation domain-containing protein n=1 Tax=Babjeviella inositovora NRRL Y-12698 TaxID=984486 RepID=A0A1E3QSZ5_9ASCO|nr:uncharacterized protein BABINDRAFT_34730 [Babjeviella inositovora NRRL Y-12698]ODQ80801.1 hypothetical protein BABINDRAFT_34730 [Babjeviella inositovora NRRL Y-12698]